ncbi:MotA/TolQ/ExbB proton channel family protein [Sulfuriferula multivorans]|uniref:MotA/TolQ/ExbB proton channel family protein n=1 Tax=Sulfuriferula multivorans TaxID=1559896 RepID=A0A401JC52_9PROT|nr:MotA/TolQ/ExbB proton channel family protein [Sulfuriferula multivorans]GBL45120.1 MotA/TolQ/ExbB proton channel family protein [Sulfuriferula multivorans]
MRKILLTLVLFLMMPQLANAWWNSEWSDRQKITLDTTATGLPLKQEVDLPLVLVRLHTGNFDFDTAKIDGGDLRFLAEDDKTPLKYHIEKFDSAAQIALVWVQVPKLQPGSKESHIWLYYGNDNANPSDDSKGSFDVNQTDVLHFAEAQGVPKDATAYGNNVTQFDGGHIPGGMIGGAVSFDGKQSLLIPASPSMKIGAANGATISFWVKPGAAQTAPMVTLHDGKSSIVVGIDGSQAYARVEGGTQPGETARAGNLAAGTWHHVAVTVGKQLTLYVDGQSLANAPAASPDMQGEVSVGKGFQGELDELELSNVARSADSIYLAALSQGAEAKLLTLGAGESHSEGSTSYFGVILQSVTLDGWVVIGILMVMAAISWMVMAMKALVINQTDNNNKKFLEAFHQLKVEETARLDADDSAEDADIKDSALMLALFGKHDHYQHSSLYQLYHAGVREVKHRFAVANGNRSLSPQAISAIKATLDGTLVRENQKLNKLMVLLTIAISGGPFLGLLGTVVGVMITFAAIAATGDVNVAAIAPGIAAALVATVAGLGVAIPALFGYNYLGSRIKNISADMHIFVDELIGRFAEAYV